MNRVLEARLIETAASCLRVPAGRIERQAPLARYGLDSLNAVELAAAFSEIAGREFTDELLLDHPSIAALAEYLEREPAPVRRGPPLERMLADSRLPEDVAPRQAPRSQSSALLVTGASGFLGAHLLAALLRETSGDIFCLVRAQDDAQALRRLVVSSPRVRALAAELDQPDLGLPAARYAELSSSVGSVLHCAAAVDWSQRYESLRGPNVLATLELLRFASHARRKSFHFVSSIAACYSARGPTEVGEGDAPVDPAGIHLGYAQSKWVGEALVREAGRRGLAVAVYRPGLIGGHSQTGAGNNDDFLARLIKGCVMLGAAPDIGWRMDACPVDFIAAALARLTVRRGPLQPVVHLLNPRRALWPEAVLWMNLRGYRMRLVPFAEWLALVEIASRDPAHPLHGLRGFLLERPVGEGGHLPELYAEPRVAAVDDTATRNRLAALGVDCPPLGAQLLETWFDAYVESGFLPPRTGLRAPRSALAPFDGARRFDLGGDNSILGELAAWRSGSHFSLAGYCLPRRRVVVKPKPEDAAVLEVACAVAELCDADLGRSFREHCGRTVLAGTASREIALYSNVDAGIVSHSPRSHGVLERDGQRALVLEHVADLELNDPVGAAERWRRPHVEAALAGIAQVHARWYGREEALLATGWLGPVPEARAASEVGDLWVGLARHAHAFFADWAGSSSANLLQQLASTTHARSTVLRQMRRGLVHHDFNPRNIGLRSRQGTLRLCALDWELATLAVPQRDLAELLCFVLPRDATSETVAHYVEFHRRQLERLCGSDIDSEEWSEGFRLALEDFAVQRLTMYLLAHRLRPRRFLQPVVQAWSRLMTLAVRRSVSTRAAHAAA